MSFTSALDTPLPIATSAPRDDRAVRIWLYVVCAMVVAMVVIGGATRLTDSGLSITEWAPLRGAIPPLNPADWLAEFDRYKQTTEYQTVNAGMTLDQFKFIYWWEWGHRQWGRLIGVVFIVPFVFFWATGRLAGWLKPRLLVLLFLGGTQAFVGWWMVASGLVNRVDVSQYRLAAHLTLACVIFAYALWLARSLVSRTEPDAAVAGRSVVLILLVLTQIALGAFVAGLDAGMVYNTWPLMDGALVPQGLVPSGDVTRDAFEDAKTVQFVHRTGAYILLLAAWAHAIWTWVSAPIHRWGALVVALLVTGQAAIGIAALVTQVRMDWALAHQLGALVVLGFAVAHARRAVPLHGKRAIA